MPKVSVIIPCFNSDKFLERALRSCFDQMFEKNDIEIIVINDGSSDNTHFISQQFYDSITYINNIENLGLPYSLNVGIRMSKSQFVIRLDSDDYFHNDALKILILYLESNPECMAVACDYLLVDALGRVEKRVNCEEQPIGCGVMFRKDALAEVGLYNEEFFMAEEVDLKLRFEAHGWTFDRLPIDLYRYRKHDNNMTNDVEKYQSYINSAKSKQQGR